MKTFKELLIKKFHFYAKTIKFSLITALILAPFYFVVTHFSLITLSMLSGFLIGIVSIRHVPNFLSDTKKRLIALSHYLFDDVHC